MVGTSGTTAHPDATGAQVSRATWTVTTQHRPWDRGPDRPITGLVMASMADAPGVMVRTTDIRQEIEGFGACFNELGWTALSRLSEDERAAVLDELFVPGAGANLSICRMPVGANDFSTDWYSYDEVPGDLTLEHFDIAHDRATLIPFIHEALRRRPELRLWASPWSPPTWMKTNGHYAGATPFPGSGVENGLAPGQAGSEGTDMLRLEPEILDVYARYFARFIEAYRVEGIAIAMVMPQNEFNSPQVFPSCTWTPNGLRSFLAVLGPRMAALGVEVFFGTQERADPALTTAVLADPEVARWVTGAGYQWAGKGAIDAVHRALPQLRLYQTEQECGDGRNDWRYARYTWSLMKKFLLAGANAYQYWNMALDEGGVSRWGWAQNSLVVVDPHTTTYRFTHEFYLLKHLSAFVHPGAHLVETFSWTGYENQLGFLNPDGSVVLVVQNDLGEDLHWSAAVDERRFDAVLPADSFSTFVVPPASGI